MAEKLGIDAIEFQHLFIKFQLEYYVPRLKHYAEVFKNPGAYEEDDRRDADDNYDLYQDWFFRESASMADVVSARKELAPRDFGIGLLRRMARYVQEEGCTDEALRLHAKIDRAFPDAEAAVERCLKTDLGIDFLLDPEDRPPKPKSALSGPKPPR